MVLSCKNLPQNNFIYNLVVVATRKLTYLAIYQVLHRRDREPWHLRQAISDVLRRCQNLLRDLRGDRDAGLADERPEEPAHRAQVLHVDRAQLSHRSLLSVQVVLPLLFQERENKCKCRDVKQ